VDDNAAGRRIVGGLLERWGARPVLAANVTEALAALEQPVDLVVLDAAIPGADGLAETIRARSGARAPIIQISARGHREGPPDEATVTRPVKLRGLADAISHALTPGPTRRAAPVAAPAAPAIVHADRVLLAEDNPVNQKVATHMLRRLGYAADVAENGAAAVAAVTREPYDVVLMDMQMPVMDGLEATRRIVAGEHFGAHRPHIIALTANAMAEDEAQCLAAGMDAFLTKPLDPERLSRALQDARERRAALA
jgi:CheY-like chemotaxis protein